MTPRLGRGAKTSLGQMLDAGRETLADYGREWWELYAKPNLERATLISTGVWDRYVLPRLGGFELRQLTPEMLGLMLRS